MVERTAESRLSPHKGKNQMDLTELLHKLAPKLPTLAEADRAKIAPHIDHMHAGVIRPVTDDERLLIAQLSGDAQ